MAERIEIKSLSKTIRAIKLSKYECDFPGGKLSASLVLTAVVKYTDKDACRSIAANHGTDTDRR